MKKLNLKDFIEFARYKCQACGYTWVQHSDIVTCPKCEHIYVEWVNHPLNQKEK